MGKYDDAMRVYLDDEERFADFFNGVLFQGEAVLLAEILESDSGWYVKVERQEHSVMYTENRFHDYGMTLFCANQLVDFSVFKTELRQLLEVIPCRKSKGKLTELFHRAEYQHLEVCPTYLESCN